MENEEQLLNRIEEEEEILSEFIEELTRIKHYGGFNHAEFFLERGIGDQELEIQSLKKELEKHKEER